MVVILKLILGNLLQAYPIACSVRYVSKCHVYKYAILINPLQIFKTFLIKTWFDNAIFNTSQFGRVRCDITHRSQNHQSRSL